MFKVPKEQKRKYVAQNRSPQQEKERASELGGRVTPGSGNKTIKGDVRVDKVLRLELKTTTKKSFSVTLEMLSKIENAALPYGEVPALEIEFLSPTGKKLQTCVIVPSYVLQHLIQDAE